jgi:hypothetical protein
MAGRVDDYERTMSFTDIALGQMKALRQPASPRNGLRTIVETLVPTNQTAALKSGFTPPNGCRAHSLGGDGQRIDETLDR